ncbi:hypothetical protein [Kitasatospora phosalacinea]|uniref:Uncharacterized protein n=1 Tax=Kitasatospora phosalacinea TaxID=2065 RepID=A0A9W6PNR3_9ACTN|nr:hypothetical protein [Kitasatospora phosalacinea]GLW58156.1 hypothetical protein Kpho01_61670 [Kitasatospora phosalacinea]
MSIYTPGELQSLRAAYPHDRVPDDEGDLTLYLATKALAEVTGELADSLAEYRTTGWDSDLADDHVSLLTKPIEPTSIGIDLLRQGGHDVQADLLAITRRTMMRALGSVLEQAENLAVHADGPGRAEAVEHLRQAFEGARVSLTAASELLQRHLETPVPPGVLERSAAARTVSRVLPSGPAARPAPDPSTPAVQAAASSTTAPARR